MTPDGSDHQAPSEGTPAIIDLRSTAHQARERPPGAVPLSLEDLTERAYLLPPRRRPLVVVADTPQQAAHATRALERAERIVRTFVDPEWREVLGIETGAPTRTRLWEPSPLVERFTREWASQVTGRDALDVACGTGRNAVHLALHGFDVTGIDHLPDALDRARDLAHRSGVRIHTRHEDLERSGVLTGVQVDVVVVVRYLDRNLFPALAAALRPGGMLVYETFTVEQRRLGHPRNPLYMLQPGELRAAFSALEILWDDEDWHDGAHTAQLIARR